MKWIKISERLPEADQYCLFFGDHHNSGSELDEKIIMAGRFWVDEERKIKAFIMPNPCCCGLTNINDVDYWMPIEEIEAPMYHVLIATPTSTTKQWLDKPDVQVRFEYKPPKESDPKTPHPIFKEWTVDLRSKE